MNLTKNHILNLTFWILILLFMGYKSIGHTVSVHEEGVISVYQDYKIQSQARLSFLKFVQGKDPFMPPIYAKLNDLRLEVERESNPYNYIILNDLLTIFLDENLEDFNLTNKEKESLLVFQSYIKQESLIFNSHAIAFNSLISRFPYNLVSGSIPQIPISDSSFVEGVIVER